MELSECKQNNEIMLNYGCDVQPKQYDGHESAIGTKQYDGHGTKWYLFFSMRYSVSGFPLCLPPLHL